MAGEFSLDTNEMRYANERKVSEDRVKEKGRTSGKENDNYFSILGDAGDAEEIPEYSPIT